MKFGFQIKSNNDVKEKEFTKNTIAQISRSKKHRVHRLFIALCADLTDSGQKEKARGLTSEVSEMGDYCIVFAPEKALRILKVYQEKGHPISQVEGLAQVMTMLHALQKKLGEDPNYDPEITLTYKLKPEVEARLEENRPLRFNIALKYPKEDINKNFWDTLKEIQLTGKSATIPSENIEKFEVFMGDKRLIPEGTKPQFLTITPERLKLPPLTLEVTNPHDKTTVSLKDIVFERDAINGTTIHVSTHNNNLPFTLRMSLDADPKTNNKVANFGISLAGNADVEKILKFEQLLSALDKGKEMYFKTPDGKTLFGATVNVNIEPREEGWLKLLQDLAYIQQKTATCIYLPDSGITHEDAIKIQHIYELLKEGKSEGATTRFKLKLPKEKANNFLQEYKKNGKIDNFGLRVDPIKHDIFGQQIVLGRGYYLIPELIIDGDLAVIEETVKKIKDDETIEIEVKNSLACTVTVVLDSHTQEKEQK